MKKTFFLVISSLILYLVFYNNAIVPDNYYEADNKEQAIQEMETEEFDSGVKLNTAFFNVAFGMTKQEVENEFKNLEKENIISNVDTQYNILGASYAMTYHEYSNYGRVYCFFNDNKLTELQVDTLNIQGDLLNLFIKKYGEADYLADNYGNTEYHWIKGNRHITIIKPETSDRLLIQYVDTSEKIKERTMNLLQKWGVFPEV
jgi:hypothetical protein